MIARRRRSTLLAIPLSLAGGIGCSSSGSLSPSSPTGVAHGAGVDLRLPARSRAWTDPVVRKDAGNGWVAILRPVTGQSTAAKLRLRGLGFPGRGESDGRSWAGPAVEKRWTAQYTGQFTATIGHTGRVISLLVWSRGGDWRAKVDGHYVTPRPLPAGSDYRYHGLTLRFAKAKRRTVTFELANGTWLAGLKVGPRDRTWLPPAVRSPAVYWLGDSFSTGTGARYPGFTDLVHAAADRLHVSNVTVDALGGTGYIKTNRVARFPDYYTRARFNLGPHRATPQIVVVAGSINDAGYGTAQIRAAATRLFRLIDIRLPRARVVVVPFTSHYPSPIGVQRSAAGVVQAARAAPNVVGVLDLTRLPLGEGGSRPGAPSRWLTSDGHPSEEGHARYGAMIADFLRARLPTLRAVRPVP